MEKQYPNSDNGISTVYYTAYFYPGMSRLYNIGGEATRYYIIREPK